MHMKKTVKPDHRNNKQPNLKICPRTEHNPQQTKEYESYGDAADSTTAALKQLQEVEYALQVFYASSP